MRNVVLYTLLSLDGVAEEPGNWMFEADDALFANLAGVIGSEDDVLLGRGTYDYWVEYWPTSDVQPFADFINGTTKHVFTSSAPSLSWSQTTVVEGDGAAYVEGLKEGRGGDMGCTAVSPCPEPARRRPRRQAGAGRRAHPRRHRTSPVRGRRRPACLNYR